MEETEEKEARSLGERIGYGRMMQLAEKLFSKKLQDIGLSAGAALSVGPCVGMLVPCPCAERVRCQWCCGSGRVTKRVAEAMSTPAVDHQPLTFLDNHEASLLIGFYEDMGPPQGDGADVQTVIGKIVAELRLRGTRDGGLF